MARRGNSAVGGLAFYLYFSSEGPPRPTRQSALELPRGPAPARRPRDLCRASPRCVYTFSLTKATLYILQKSRAGTDPATVCNCYAYDTRLAIKYLAGSPRRRASSARAEPPASFAGARVRSSLTSISSMMHVKQTRHFHDSVSAGRSRGSVTGHAVTANKCIFSRFTSQVPSLRGI